MFLTVRPGKVFTNANGQRYGGGSEIDVDEKTGEGLIRNEVATWSEHKVWREANFKQKAISIKTIEEKPKQETKSVYETLTETPPKEETPAPGTAVAEVLTPPETSKKRVGRPPKE